LKRPGKAPVTPRSCALGSSTQRAGAVGEKQPALEFLYNLGDVVYFNGVTNLYMREFYELYPGALQASRPIDGLVTVVPH